VVHQFQLDDETVEHAHPVQPIVVDPDVSVREVFEQFRRFGRGCLLVCRDEVLEGIFTERDALKLMSSGADLDIPIKQVMTAPVVTLRSDDTVADAIQCMSLGGYRRLPIVDERLCPIGVLETTGILHYLVEHFPRTIYNLPPSDRLVMQHREGA